jgi:beta-phosphoglucomutase-like phosphatase (HAD superfamily)
MAPDDKARAVRAVIFDFNGTISDDEPVLDRLFREMAGGLGLALSTEDYFRELAGLSDPAIVARILELAARDEDPDALLRWKIDRYKRIVAEHPTIGEKNAAFVRACADRVPIAIASGAVREEVEHVLALAGLDELFAAIVCADDVERGKPDPQGYELALAGIGEAVAPADVLVFEDADNGVRAAQAAGMRCAALRTPAYTAGADVELDRLDVAQVSALLGR